MLAEPVEKLGAFFHYGKVSCKVSIKYVIKTQCSQGRGHLTCNKCSGGHSEFFTKSSTHCGSSLYYNSFGWIYQSSEHLWNMIYFSKSACRTHRHTLSAVGTCGMLKILFKCGSHCCHEASVDGRNCTD